MKDNHYYKSLNLKNTSSWAEVRKSYKSLIQKWHPDKHEEGSIDKDIANEKIRDINKAYNYLSTYYRKNGSLPFDKTPETTLQKNTTPVNSKNDINPKQEPQPLQGSLNIDIEKPNITPQFVAAKKLIHAISILMILSFTLYFLVQNEPDTHMYTNQGKHLQNNNNQQTLTYTASKISKSKIEVEVSNPALSKPSYEDYFSYGSTLGQVAFIQGMPSKIEGNIWYYGKSEVHFHDGKVVNWIRSAKYPLKIQLKDNRP